ncbi:MAG: MBL fold metallo-hydrolase [Desulfitobacteriaceae bacterium]
MSEEVLENIFRVEIPLPNNPLKALNSYIIKGAERNLIIDTGMNREECLKAMLSGLSELGVNLEETDFFITHLHADHLGLVSSLVTPSSKIYFNQPDSEIFGDESKWEEQKDFAILSGFSELEVQQAIEKHPGYRYKATGKLQFQYLREGDSLDIGGYQFRCLETPGHTQGHMCLYDASRKILVSGDHILGRITPNISSWSDDENPLSEYIGSLDKIAALDVDIVLPGHRSIFYNCQERIRELKEHHAERANEIMDILAKGSLNAYQVAALMTWDMSYKTWEEFPVSQKWFATGEAVAHLKYLEEKGYIIKENTGLEIVYTLARHEMVRID